MESDGSPDSVEGVELLFPVAAAIIQEFEGLPYLCLEVFERLEKVGAVFWEVDVIFSSAYDLANVFLFDAEKWLSGTNYLILR